MGKTKPIFIILAVLVLVSCQVTLPPPKTPPTPVAVTSMPTISAVETPTVVTAAPPPTVTAVPGRHFPDRPLPLSAYPRPPADNGMGIHWSTHLYAQSDEATDYFVQELARMNVKWVKLLNDSTTGRDYDRTIEALVSRDIMPILRIYQRCNTPYDQEELDALVRHYAAKGVYYYDLYNEPNLPGESGGWCQPDGQPRPEYLAEIWADAARTIYLAGGYPGLPSFFAPSQKRAGWREDFFYQFFDALRQQGNEETLFFSWASIHNYTLNHPPTYPYDEVNLTGRLLTPAEIELYDLDQAQVEAINQARLAAREPGGFFLGDNLYDDSTAFFHFIAYRNQFYDLFGFEIPMLSTEGGATRGSSEDPRYPPLDGRTVAEWTLWMADYMLNDAPDYYFATSTWLLAQYALDYAEPVWESNAWYHDRSGDQEPVVEALKTRPRLEAARPLCFENDPDCLARRVDRQAAALYQGLLQTYPRPAGDNGRGVHWAPTVNPMSPDVVDYFMEELRAMNVKWVKLLQADLPEVTHTYLLQQLAAHDIEPIMRVYQPFNDPYLHLAELVPQARALGVDYFELYNEPNLAGPAGGWPEGQPINLARMVDLWILAAREVHAAGGFPSLPPLAGGGTVDDMVFLAEFLDEVRARGQAGLLPGSWIPVHNYFLNHPLDYPTDPVNVNDAPLSRAEIVERGLTPEQVAAINHARRIAKLPREQGGFWVGNTIHEDSNAFGKFEAYAAIFYRRFGYHLPVIGTEGGAIAGAAEDPRYPPVRPEDVTELTLAAYHVMLDGAPDYFFAHTAWLLANSAGEHNDERFEHAAWYKDREGTVLPVVPALKADPRRREVRQ